MLPSSTSRDLAPRVDLKGANLLRFLAVLTVLYSHISFYLIDDLGTGWWGLDLVYELFIARGGLNQHLSFLGVAVFMTLTGALITRSAIRHSPQKFLLNRLGRLLPAFWVAIVAAIVLVRLGINGMFSGQVGVSNSEAVLSFFLGNFFLKPEVAVLGVAWTLTVQVTFYFACVFARPILRATPIIMPLAGAAICSLILLYNLYVPQPYSVPMLSKIAATLPTVFLGQIIYLGWARLADWRLIVIAAFAQIEVVRFATEFRVYWAGDRYLWTIAVVTACVVLIGRYDGQMNNWAVVRWTAQRSYTIYLVHTLVLYRVYENTVGHFGQTGAIIAFLVVMAAVAEALYRWVEVPAARKIAAWTDRRAARAAKPPDRVATDTPAPRVASGHVLVRRTSGSRISR
ncbi:acyltransferase family protein [Rhodococcus sp. NPDC058521]|uniref:acyltransferase family protein n=1 Tax=Rhodococcus sp. NPDC058521 TaxID=3346536 RepID=UPI00364EF5AF